MAFSGYPIMDLLVSTHSLALHGVKVSFKTSTASAWGTSFLHCLNAELERALRTDHQQLTNQVCHSAQALFDARYRSLPGLPCFTVLGMCVLILSAYRVLLVQLGSSGKAFEMVERSFDQTYQAFVNNICKPLYLDAKRSPQNLAKMNFSDWSKRMYRQADSQTSGAPAVNPDGDAKDYHLFFQQQGEPGLSQIIEAADQAWAKVIAEFSGPVCADPCAELCRTRASDAGFCPFRFAPKDVSSKQAGPDQVLELLIGAPGTSATRKGEI